MDWCALRLRGRHISETCGVRLLPAVRAARKRKPGPPRRARRCSLFTYWRLIRRPMPPSATKIAPRMPPRSGVPVTASGRPVSAVAPDTPPVAVEPLTPPPALPPALPPPGLPPPVLPPPTLPVVFPELGALPAVLPVLGPVLPVLAPTLPADWPVLPALPALAPVLP